jgi:hypothetical protein
MPMVNRRQRPQKLPGMDRCCRRHPRCGSVWYGPVLPSAPEVRVRHPVVRGGVFMLGGMTHVDGMTYGRLDIGVPTGTRRFRQLRALLVSELHGSTEQDIAMRTLAIAPTMQLHWRLPISLESGEVFATALAGLQRSQTWMKRPDEPFWPSRWESASTWSFRVAAGVEYRSHRGLIASAQPLIVVPITDADPTDPRWMTSARHTSFGMSIVAGYQFK